MKNRAEIITLSRNTPETSYLLAAPTNTKEVLADEGVVALGAFIGMVTSGVATAFTFATSGTGDPILGIMATMMGMVIGGLAFGGVAFFYSLTNELRQEVGKLNSRSRISIFDAWKAITTLRSKKTIVSLGKDSLGNEIQAYIKASFICTTLAQVTAPKVTETWDDSITSVASLYSISKPTKQKMSA